MNITFSQSVPGGAVDLCILTDWHTTDASSVNLSNASEWEGGMSQEKGNWYQALGGQQSDSVIIQTILHNWFTEQGTRSSGECITGGHEPVIALTSDGLESPYMIEKPDDQNGG